MQRRKEELEGLLFVTFSQDCSRLLDDNREAVPYFVIDVLDSNDRPTVVMADVEKVLCDPDRIVPVMVWYGRIWMLVTVNDLF